MMEEKRHKKQPTLLEKDTPKFKDSWDDLPLEEFYDIKRTVECIKSNNLKKIALQFPYEMYADAVQVCAAIQQYTNRTVFIIQPEETSCSMLYSPCCVDEDAAENGHADLIVHYGRACFAPTRRIPVLYVFGRGSIDATHCLESFLSHFGTNAKVLLFYDVYYEHCISHLETLLRNLAYKDVRFSRINSGLRPKAAPTSSSGSNSNSNGEQQNKTSKTKASAGSSNGSGKKSPREKETATTGTPNTTNTTTQTNLQSNALTSSTQNGQPAVTTTSTKTSTLHIDTSLLNMETFCGREFQIPPEQSVSDYTIFYIGEESPLLVWTYNPTTRTIHEEKRRLNRSLVQKVETMQRIKDSEVIQVVVGSAVSVSEQEVIDKLKAIVSGAGKKLIVDQLGGAVSSNKTNRKPDAYVFLACHEHSFTYSKECYKPVLTPLDLELALTRSYAGMPSTDSNAGSHERHARDHSHTNGWPKGQPRFPDTHNARVPTMSQQQGQLSPTLPHRPRSPTSATVAEEEYAQPPEEDELRAASQNSYAYANGGDRNGNFRKGGKSFYRNNAGERGGNGGNKSARGNSSNRSGGNNYGTMNGYTHNTYPYRQTAQMRERNTKLPVHAKLSSNAKGHLTPEQLQKLNRILDENYPVVSKDGDIAIDVSSRDLIQRIQRRIQKVGIYQMQQGIRFVGSGAAYVVSNININNGGGADDDVSVSHSAINDLDFCFYISDSDRFLDILTLEEEVLAELIEQQTGHRFTLREIYEKFFLDSVKVETPETGESWSLITIGKKSHETIDIKFVYKSKRSWAFSTDSFEIVLDPLFHNSGNNSRPSSSSSAYQQRAQTPPNLQLSNSLPITATTVPTPTTPTSAPTTPTTAPVLAWAGTPPASVVTPPAAVPVATATTPSTTTAQSSPSSTAPTTTTPPSATTTATATTTTPPPPLTYAAITSTRGPAPNPNTKVPVWGPRPQSQSAPPSTQAQQIPSPAQPVSPSGTSTTAPVPVKTAVTTTTTPQPTATTSSSHMTPSQENAPIVASAVATTTTTTTATTSTATTPSALPVTEEGVLVESLYGNYQDALRHLQDNSLCTTNPHEIRRGIFRYCYELSKGRHPKSEQDRKELEKTFVDALIAERETMNFDEVLAKFLLKRSSQALGCINELHGVLSRAPQQEELQTYFASLERFRKLYLAQQQQQQQQETSPIIERASTTTTSATPPTTTATTTSTS